MNKICLIGLWGAIMGIAHHCYIGLEDAQRLSTSSLLVYLHTTHRRVEFCDKVLKGWMVHDKPSIPDAIRSLERYSKVNTNPFYEVWPEWYIVHQRLDEPLTESVQYMKGFTRLSGYMDEFRQSWHQTVENLHLQIDKEIQDIEKEVEEVTVIIQRCVEVDFSLCVRR